MWRDSSFCSRMLPTCGPLPCATTTSWPALTRSARRALVASIRFRWARTSEGSPGGKSALPPTATTSFVTQRLRGRPVHFGQSIRRFGRGNGPRERAPPGERHIYLSAARIAARCEPGGAPGLPGYREPDDGVGEWIGRSIPGAALDVVRFPRESDHQSKRDS